MKLLVSILFLSSVASAELSSATFAAKVRSFDKHNVIFQIGSATIALPKSSFGKKTFAFDEVVLVQLSQDQVNELASQVK